MKASNTDASDFFGGDVDLSADGKTVVVGATGEDSNASGTGGNEGDESTANSDAVYVFTRSAGTWTLQAYVKAPNAGAYEGFHGSFALSVDSNTLLVGATLETSNAIGIGGNQNDSSAGFSAAVYPY